ncbi:hypothetical protein [Oenococcus oeni]|nr:hypothetical protein [Oenococcus oeni]
MNQFEKIIISDELNNLLERFYKDTGASYIEDSEDNGHWSYRS